MIFVVRQHSKPCGTIFVALGSPFGLRFVCYMNYIKEHVALFAWRCPAYLQVLTVSGAAVLVAKAEVGV